MIRVGIRFALPVCMEIRFWGVRGSIATPGPATAHVGGNTSCVEVVCGQTRLILDAGTGLRPLGNALLGQPSIEAAILLTHYHWDHIQGIPFFLPAYIPSTKLEIIGAEGKTPIRDALSRQMSAPHFPVDLSDLGAFMKWREVKLGHAFEVGEAKIRAAKLNHPGGVTAYRIEHRGRVLVYATDTEHYACVDPVLLQLAKGADVLVYDAQYTPEEYPKKVGWGHSTFDAGVEVAKAAGVSQLVLYHHDPLRDDAGVAMVEARARELFPDAVAAREGMEIDLGPASLEHAA
jgi:phosphoribosyl 1,2-cyclic phosphodiesterase